MQAGEAEMNDGTQIGADFADERRSIGMDDGTQIGAGFADARR
jgi:hypothetical protein